MRRWGPLLTAAMFGASGAAPPAFAQTHSDHHERPLPASTAYAAPLTASEDTCMSSRSFGVQGLSFGISFATTWNDKQCYRLKNARALENLGYHDAALELLCMDRSVRVAMDRAGTPCSPFHVEHAERLPSPPAEPLEQVNEILGRYEVLFDFDSARLKPESDAILAPLLTLLQNQPDLNVVIEGHADWVGTDAYNLHLSRRRAQSVVNWLVERGIAWERLHAVGKGEREPIESNRTASGRAHNRRVEVHRITTN